MNGNFVILGVVVVAGTSIEFENAAGNRISRDAFLDAFEDGVTVVRARGAFGSPPPVILAGRMEIVPHREAEGPLPPVYWKVARTLIRRRP